ncbi:hypothetical protein BDR06DRAFT_1000371 [Suillus hirtellus]|nr:hypothetical protein BDR06DRAFT_1000371 [Suillus hirtellus]
MLMQQRFITPYLCLCFNAAAIQLALEVPPMQRMMLCGRTKSRPSKPCLLLETTLSDAPHDDLVWNSVMLHTSDLYTHTLYWDALVAVDAVFRISVDLWVLQDWDGEEEVLQSTPFNDKFIFSCVSAMGRYESGKRVVVTLQQDGHWHCHLCRYSDACKHKPHAKAFALEARLMVNMQDGHQMGAMDDAAGDEESAVLVHVAQCEVNLAKHCAISCLPIPPPRWCALPAE